MMSSAMRQRPRFPHALNEPSIASRESFGCGSASPCAEHSSRPVVLAIDERTAWTHAPWGRGPLPVAALVIRGRKRVMDAMSTASHSMYRGPPAWTSPRAGTSFAGGTAEKKLGRFPKKEGRKSSKFPIRKPAKNSARRDRNATLAAQPAHRLTRRRGSAALRAKGTRRHSTTARQPGCGRETAGSTTEPGADTEFLGVCALPLCPHTPVFLYSPVSGRYPRSSVTIYTQTQTQTPVPMQSHFTAGAPPRSKELLGRGQQRPMILKPYGADAIRSSAAGALWGCAGAVTWYMAAGRARSA
eukprot:scaffold10291_cov146-Isochrysis_galbana.AAC.3